MKELNLVYYAPPAWWNAGSVLPDVYDVTNRTPEQVRRVGTDLLNYTAQSY